MKFHRIISRVDFTLQTVAIVVFIISFFAFDEYTFFGIISIGIIQALSILYYSLLYRKGFTRRRKLHYNLTSIILILLFAAFLSQFIDTSTEIFILIVLFNALLLGGLLILYYYIITLLEMLEKSKSNHQ